MSEIKMSTQQFVFASHDYRITIKGTGAVRATVGKTRFVKVGQHIYGKQSSADRITDDHALLSIAAGIGYPFVARAEETCAEALLQLAHRARKCRFALR